MGGDLMLGEARSGRTSVSHTVIGGLITSTLLTLFVVPVVYTLLDDLVLRLRRGRGTSHAPRREPEPVAAD